MKSKVYFIASRDSDNININIEKLKRLLEESKVLGAVKKGDSVAVKIHFGEEGNTGHVRPEYAGVICRDISGKKAKPFLTDTNTLYRGRRIDCEEHKKLAYQHGFTKDVCGADITIPDDKNSEISNVPVSGKFIKMAKIFSIYVKAGAIVDISHFKGHLMTGFGGALKNVGMGCATREGKLAQHSEIAPVIDYGNCINCLACADVCPKDAITLKTKKVFIDQAKCIGCASCIAVCPQNALSVDWEAGGSMVTEKMIEYASAILKNHEGRAAFINFATRITKECDCLAKDDPRIVPDIGIFASNDPVSVDKACYDAVLKACGKDIFKEVHPRRDGLKQIEYACKLGIGNMKYELKELS